MTPLWRRTPVLLLMAGAVRAAVHIRQTGATIHRGDAGNSFVHALREHERYEH